MALTLQSIDDPLLVSFSDTEQKTEIKKKSQAIDPKSFRLLTPRMAAECIGVNYYTLTRWRHRGIGPDYVILPARQGPGNRVGYRPEAIEDFVMRLQIRADRMPQPGRGRLAGKKNKPKT